MTKLNILRGADIRNSTSCRYDTNKGYSVSWQDDGEFRQYEEFSGITTRIVSNNNYFFVTTSGTCYVGPTADQHVFDANIYNQVDVTYRLEIGPGQQSPTKGRIQFQTSDDPTYDSEKVVDFNIDPNNSYNTYTVDMTQVRLWEGSISRIRIYPIIDGAPGNKVHLKSLSVRSTSTFSCSSIFDGNGVCSKFLEYSHPCPWVGSGGSCSSKEVNDGVEIVKDVNDTLLVNINGYGDQRVTLTPSSAALTTDIARDIEDKLSAIGIAGYSKNKTEVVNRKIIITADDTRGIDSNVVVQDTPAARTLGFYSSNGGEKTSTSTPGVLPASRYDTAGTILLSKSEIAHFYRPNQTVSKTEAVSLQPSDYAIEGGRKTYHNVTRSQYIDFSAATVIDFNRPITGTGLFTFFGYSGDATIDTEILVFRPNSTGQLTLIHSEMLGETTNFISRVFEKEMNVRLREGDLLGIYSGKIYTGGDAEKPNTTYFLHPGKLSVGETISFPKMYGNGSNGLHLYARGRDKKSEVVLDVIFDSVKLVEEIEVVAEEEVREEIINLTQAKGGGINGGPYITGETGLDSAGIQAPPMVNLGALTDGVKFNTPDSIVTYPGWVEQGFSSPNDFSQTTFSLTLDFARAVPVFFEISKVIMYFRDEDNIKMFRIDYPITADAFDINQYWGPVTDKFTSVFLDGKELTPDSHPVYSHPIRVNSENFEHSYKFLTYNSIEVNFNPVSARSIRYGVKNYFFNDDQVSSGFSTFDVAKSPNILEMEVFATSTPSPSIADNFYFESVREDGAILRHSVVRDLGKTSANYLIGYPVKALKLHIIPQSKLGVKSITATVSESDIKVVTNKVDTASLQFSYKDYTSVSNITIENKDSIAYNYRIDIAAQRNTVDRCLLWNKMGSDDELLHSQVGPSPSVHTRDGFLVRETSFAYKSPAYIVDPFWMLNANAKSYISYDHGSTWESRGSTATNYSFDEVDELSSKNEQYLSYTYVYIMIDLGGIYAPNTVEIMTRAAAGVVGFSSSVLYSAENVSTPEELDVTNDFVSTKGVCRWLMLRGNSHDPESFTSVPTLSFIRMTLDPLNTVSFNSIPWVEAPYLTNSVYGVTSDDGNCGEGWHCPEPAIPDPPHYYAVDLEDHYDIYNVLSSPNRSAFDNFASITDIDNVLPGHPASMYTTGSKLNSDIAYGVTNVTDPNKVHWSSFGAAPTEYTRWLLLKADGWLIDEVGVYVNENDPEKKPQFASTRWWTSKVGEVVKDYTITSVGTHSIGVDYPGKVGPLEEEIEIVHTLGTDQLLAKKDQLKVLFYVSDVSQIDLTSGHIAIGRNTSESNGGNSPLQGTQLDRDNYYQWNLSDMPGLITTGWNELYLPFTDNFRQGQPYFTRGNLLSIGADTSTGRSRFRWFRVNFSGIEDNLPFSVRITSVDIVRASYVPAKFGNGRYLANTDYAKFPLSNFNVMQGTIEFFLRPDWTKTYTCNTCNDPKDHNIFRVFNSDDFMLGLFMTGEGMRIYATNGKNTYSVLDNNSPLNIHSGVDTHIAVTWDFMGDSSDKGLCFYVNGTLSSMMSATQTTDTFWTPNPNCTFMLGGKAWDGIVDTTSGSVDGAVDNLKIYNYAKDDFSWSLVNQGLEPLRPSDDLLEISLDGATFFGSDDRGSELPLLVKQVFPGEKFKVYIRNKKGNQPDTAQTKNRTAFIEVVKSEVGL